MHSSSSHNNNNNSSSNNNNSSSSKHNSFHRPIHEEKRLSAITNNNDDEHDDDTSTSASSTSTQSSSSHQSLDQRTRARRRALRYLSNSCVDAGRKAKTLSYVWGLERLDLKRRRDRYERELGVVEGEMNKDWGGGAAATGLDMDTEADKVAEMARRLVRELPRVALANVGSTGGADAGAGSQKGESSKKAYMTMDEYADALQDLEPCDTNMDWEEDEEDNHPSKLIWTNDKALELYTASLQSRLRDAMERTKSLEKRLAVLEKTGDDIVGSLCEDLVDVTSHCNKAEARYVKRGKELERKRRREEVRYRSNIKELEKKINMLEERILVNSGGKSVHVKNFAKYLNSETSDSEEDEDDEENDEIRLEKKLSDIKEKIDLEKAEHERSVQSIRRQCEQCKLRLSVARLVMAGDDNLREYISLLDRFDPTLHHQRRSCSQFGESSYSNDFQEGIPMEALPPPPPSKVTRIRAKLLKAIHLERIYEQRLAVSKAFNDAAINALEHELAEREMAGQQMEVRCLNELMVIDSEIKDIVSKGEQKVKELQKELAELEDAMAVISSKRALVDGEDGSAHNDAITSFQAQPALESALSTDNDSTSSDSSNDAKGMTRDGVIGTDDDSSMDKDCLDHSKKSEGNDSAPLHLNGFSDKNAMGPKIASVKQNCTQERNRDEELLEEMHLGDVNPNTPVELNDQPDDKTSIHHNRDQAKTKVEVSFHDSTKPDSASANEIDVNEFVASLKRGASTNGCSNPVSDKREGLLKILGQELKCTLAEYQTSFDISSSSDRVEQLDYMNKVVLGIAEVAGITLSKAENEKIGVKSWSHPLSEDKKSSKARSKAKSSKTSAKRKKRKSKKEKETDDGLSEKDRLFLASLSEAKFSQMID
ncbi:hypothetical protein ACHAWX_006072 [Stephanocyclus meneghinianus]